MKWRHLYFVLFVLLFCNSCDCYWNIQLSEQPITSVPFASARIAVWKNENGDNSTAQYFAMPLVQLMNQSAEIVRNALTKRIQIEFKIIMWSEEVGEAIFSYLRRHVNRNIGEDDAIPLPISKVRLLWKDRLNPLDSAYRLMDQWQSNTAQSSVLTFRIVCRELDACTTLKNVINTSPETLYSLDLDYVINGEQSTRRTVTVSGNNAVGAELHTKLSNMSTPSRFRYLTSDDVFTLAKQTVANTVSSIKSKSNYVDNGDEAALAELLHKHWRQSRAVPATNLRAEQWGAVYWSPAATRPDRISQYLNRVLSDNPASSEDFLLDISWKTTSEGLDEELNVRGIFNTTSMNDPGASNSKTPINKALVLSRLRDNLAGRTVVWSGNAFRVKAIPFYRLNLDSLSGSRKLVSGPIEVGEYRSVGSVRVRPQEAVPRKAALALARQSRDEARERITAEALRSRIQSIADNWPEYCYIAQHYCHNDTYYGSVTGKTLSECKVECEESPLCQSFLHWSDDHCRLRTFVCSSAEMRPYANHHYYIKVWRVVPSIISKLLKSENLDEVLTKVPTNPCERIGFHNYFAAWADQSQG